MTACAEDTSNPAWMRPRTRFIFILLMCLHIVLCCLSLAFVANFYPHYKVIWFERSALPAAVLAVALFSFVALLFVRSRFSFGYVLGFYFYTMIVGYLWLAPFSRFQYNHALTMVSAFVSAVAFLVPALFITAPIRSRLVLSRRAFDNLLSGILILAAAVIASGAYHNFRLISVADIYHFRAQLEFPGWLRYALAVTSNALLPFAFACFVAQARLWRAALVMLCLLLFYPITLSKLALFAPLWLMFLALLFRFFEARISVVLSLFLPLLGGIILALIYKYSNLPDELFSYYFATINLRMVAFPSIAIDVYNDYFSTHSLTHFCQINLLKPFVECPYSEPLSIIMQEAYNVGNFNASLFATEGVASVGPLLAPLVVLACGLVIALGNRLSSGLPPKFILLSGGVIPQFFLNVPMTTTLLTGGAAFLFVLWYLTPRAMFDEAGDPLPRPDRRVSRKRGASPVPPSAHY